MSTEKRLAEKLVDYYNQTRTTQTPPDDWVLFKAARLCGWDTQIEGLRRLYGGDKTFRALCDMIEMHEAFKQEVSDAMKKIVNDPNMQPHKQEPLYKFIIDDPVDRKLLCAREAMKSWVGGGAGPETICIRAIELWEEGFGK